MSNTQLAKSENLTSLIKRPEYAGRFQQLLKDRADQFISSIIQVGQSMPDVQPTSVIAAGMMAASLDLPVNKSLGFAWIVPYNDKRLGKVAQFQVGYKGYIQLALRSGAYSRMNAVPINKEAIAGYDDVVGEPIVKWSELDTLKPAVAFAFGFRLTNGFAKLAVWTRGECESHASRFSQSYRSGAAIWKDFQDEMFLKTVVANELRKWGILSVQMQRAMFVDQSAAKDVDTSPEYIDGAGAAGMITGGNGADQGPGATAGNPDEQAERDMGLAPDVKTGTRQPAPAAAQDDQAVLANAEKQRQQKAAQTTTQAAQTKTPGPVLTKAAFLAAMSPQETIAKGCTEHGITFEKFRDWAGQIIKDADSIASWDELPTEKCKLWLLAGDDLFTEVAESQP